MSKTNRRPPIDWVICAAGDGKRFADHGIGTAKPCLHLAGLTMLERSVACLDVMPGDQVLIITRKGHGTAALRPAIEAIFPWAAFKWVELAKPTRGQLETFLKVSRFLRPRAGVAIWNCDTYFRSGEFNRLLSDPAWDGIVPCGKLPGSSWSFFLPDEQMGLLDAKEKTRISPWASVGLYYFRNSTALLKLAEKALRSPPPDGMKEHYVSAVYPLLVKAGKRIRVCGVDLFLPYGTPEQVSEYWGIGLRRLLKDNPPRP